MPVEGDTDVGRAPEVRAANEKVGEGSGYWGAGRGKLGQTRLV